VWVKSQVWSLCLCGIFHWFKHKARLLRVFDSSRRGPRNAGTQNYSWHSLSLFTHFDRLAKLEVLLRDVIVQASQHVNSMHPFHLELFRNAYRWPLVASIPSQLNWVSWLWTESEEWLSSKMIGISRYAHVPASLRMWVIQRCSDFGERTCNRWSIEHFWGDWILIFLILLSSILQLCQNRFLVKVLILPFLKPERLSFVPFLLYFTFCFSAFATFVSVSNLVSVV